MNALLRPLGDGRVCASITVLSGGRDGFVANGAVRRAPGGTNFSIRRCHSGHSRRSTTRAPTDCAAGDLCGPAAEEKPAPWTTVSDPAKGWIDAILREDATAARKQKYTARRIHQRLAQEYGFYQASYSTVCNYFLARRPQVEAEVLEGCRHLTGMVPQVHLPGEEAEEDCKTFGSLP